VRRTGREIYTLLNGYKRRTGADSFGGSLNKIQRLLKGFRRATGHRSGENLETAFVRLAIEDSNTF
jgi:hypothetical protein